MTSFKQRQHPSNMLIRITFTDRPDIYLCVSENDTISTVKSQIRRSPGIHATWIDLCHSGSILMEQYTLAQLDIPDLAALRCEIW